MTDRDDAALPALGGEDATITPLLPGILIAEIERAAAYAKASRASSTQRVYASDWKIFLAWCEQRSIAALPADIRKLRPD